MVSSQLACLVIVGRSDCPSILATGSAGRCKITFTSITRRSIRSSSGQRPAVYKRIGKNAGLPPSAVEEVEAKRKRAPRRLRINLCHENKEARIEGSINPRGCRTWRPHKLRTHARSNLQTRRGEREANADAQANQSNLINQRAQAEANLLFNQTTTSATAAMLDAWQRSENEQVTLCLPSRRVVVVTRMR